MGPGIIPDSELARVPVLHTNGMAIAALVQDKGTVAEGLDDFGNQVVRLSKSVFM